MSRHDRNDLARQRLLLRRRLGATEQLAYTAKTWRADGSNEDTATLLAAYNTWEQLHATNSTVFNVKDPAYGAVGDGVADDTAKIQAAITAAAVLGGVVLLPPGTYLVSGSGFSAIDPKSNISLVGAGRTATVIKLANAANRIVIANTVGVSDLTISDLTIDGNKANQTTGGNGIEIGSSSRVTITRVRVINAYARGINVTATTDSLVAFNEVESNGPGATTTGALELRSGSNNCRVIGNRVLNPSGHGIEVGAFGCVGCDVIGNIVVNPQNSGGIGIALAGSQYVNCNGNYVTSTLTDGNCIDQGNATDTVIANNVVQGGANGIDADSGARVAFVGNVCSNNHNVGISMEFSNQGATTAFDAVVTGNMVSGAGDSGIALDGVTNGIVSGNIVKNSSKITAGKAGISIRTTLRAATGIAIQGNRCYDDQGSKTQTYGIQSTGTADFLTVTDNDVRGNLTGAISLVGTNNKVRNNMGYATEAGGTSTQTPGAVAVVNIAHGLAAAPMNYSVLPGDANSRGEPTFYLTADATNVILNFSGNLTAATAYTWRWRAEV